MNEIIEGLNELVPNPKCPLNYTRDYELLLAVMLSAQTADERVNEVTKELFKYDIKELSKMDEDKIESVIKSVGMGKKKAHFIKEICTKLLSDTNGIVPHDRNYVESLPGVGHKTCNVAFSELFNEEAFAVDTHVKRVSNRLGITNSSDSVETIEKKLCNYFPSNLWKRLHVQMVLFGRYTCTSKNPLCSKCPFKNKQCKTPNK